MKSLDNTRLKRSHCLFDESTHGIGRKYHGSTINRGKALAPFAVFTHKV